MGSSATSQSARRVINEINITPLTDIFLVLLIIMMVVAPMMRQLRGDITPPDVQAGSPVDQDKITVEVTTSGEYFIDGESVTAQSLPQVLSDKHQAQRDAKNEMNENRTVQSGDDGERALSPVTLPVTGEDEAQKPSGMLIIRADKQSLSRSVLTVFDAARTAGFEKVTIAGEAPSSELPNTLSGLNQSGIQGGTQGGMDASSLFEPVQ